ncbi:hypothetical protein [Desulfotomaculum defluvii]
MDKRKLLEENLEIARKTEHTRFPLINGDSDHVIGLVHIKDLFRLDDRASIEKVKRNIMMVPGGHSTSSFKYIGQKPLRRKTCGIIKTSGLARSFFY